MVEGTGLENRQARKGLVSSNLTLSARRSGPVSGRLLLQGWSIFHQWTGGRVVEGAPLETV